MIPMNLRILVSKRFAIALLLVFLCTIFGATVESPSSASATTPGTIGTVAGNGSRGYSGDGGPAASAALYGIGSLAVDASGNIYIVDSFNNRIRKVDTSGIITTIAGNGSYGYSGDGGPATGAEFREPYGVAVDASGNIYIADTYNSRIRKVDTSGIITTIAGNGAYLSMYYGEGGAATKAAFFPGNVAVDASGNIYIADPYDNRICKVDKDDIITTVAGNGSYSYSGDGGPAVKAGLDYPTSVAVDASGNIYIADAANNAIRKVDKSGIITTVAGTGVKGYFGDGGPAVGAGLDYPTSVAVDASGNIYIGDTNNYCIRKVDTSGAINTVVSNCIPGGIGGGPVDNPRICVAVDASGNLYFSEFYTTVCEEKAPILPSATGRKTIVFTVGQPSYTVDGRSFAMDASPFISNGRVLVPVRYLADALGVQTAWDTSHTGAVQQVYIISRNVSAILIIGSATMETSIDQGGGSPVSKIINMDVAPVIINGRTYLPARYVTDTFGCKIYWNEEAQTITISQQSM